MKRAGAGFPLGAESRARDGYIVKTEQISAWFPLRAPKTKGNSHMHDILHQVEIIHL